MFEKGIDEELTRLESLSSSLTSWISNMKVNYSLPMFFSKDQLNRVTQLTGCRVEKVDMDDVESDYSTNYDFEAKNK